MRLIVSSLAALAAAWAVSASPANSSPSKSSSGTNAVEQARVALGRRLFYDADLSANGTMACATCHEQNHAFGDGNTTHPGVTDEPGRRNVPGLADVGRFARLTVADPKATTLEAQVATPLFGHRPVEMGMDGLRGEFARRLGAQACYRTMFAAAFPAEKGRIDIDTLGRALAAFERTITTRPPAPPTDPQALAGRTLFAKACASCHSGPDFSDFAYHRLEGSDPTREDQGLFESTGRAADRGRFRTTPLRNVTLTGPWWHDGSARTLEEALRRHRQSLTAPQTAALIAYLGSLSDKTLLSRPDLAMPQTACGAPL